jgi:transposase InsO family protein
MLRASFSHRSSQTEKAVSATAFLKATVAYDSGLGVTASRVMTDNGSCSKSFAFARTCRRLKIKHIRTKPYPPKTNGKGERFIQTALREWAKLTKGSSRRSQLEWSAEGYVRAYQTSDHRVKDLPYWTHQYNLHRPTRQPKINAAHQPPRSHRGQPVEAPW